MPWGALGEMSIAAGRIEPRGRSWVHTHPAVTQVTYLLKGRLTVRMRDAGGGRHYDLDLEPGQAALSEPGALFQLRNESDALAEVLYIVSPSYVFEMDGNNVVHDDSILVSPTWEELEAVGYDAPALRISRAEAVARRAEAIRRLATRKGAGST